MRLYLILGVEVNSRVINIQVINFVGVLVLFGGVVIK